MEIWELNQLSRAEIEKMREDVELAFTELEDSRLKVVNRVTNQIYPSSTLSQQLENILVQNSDSDFSPKSLALKPKKR